MMLERAVLSAAMVLALVVCGRWTEQWQSGIYHDMGDPALGACLGACTLAAAVLLFPLILATYKLDERHWNTKGWPLSTAINCMHTVWDVLQAIMNLVRVYSYSNFFLEHLLAIYGFVRVILLPPPFPIPIVLFRGLHWIVDASTNRLTCTFSPLPHLHAVRASFMHAP
jgi:hypothetical protein